MSADFEPPSAHRSDEELTDLFVPDVIGGDPVPVSLPHEFDIVVGHSEQEIRERITELRLRLNSQLEAIASLNIRDNTANADRTRKQALAIRAEIAMYQRALAVKLDSST